MASSEEELTEEAVNVARARIEEHEIPAVSSPKYAPNRAVTRVLARSCWPRKG